VPNENHKSKTLYKILIAGSAGVAIPTALQAMRDANIPGAESVIESSGREGMTQTLGLDFASFDISSHERILLYSVPGQEQFTIVRDMLQKGAIGLVLLIDNARADPRGDLDSCMKLLETFIDRTGVVIGIKRTGNSPDPDLHDYHAHLAKTRSNLKGPPPIMEVAPGELQEMKKLLLSLLFHLNPSL
jgi:signal recognition particle receptor subunit beta